VIAFAFVALSLAGSPAASCDPSGPSGAVCSQAADGALRSRITALLGSIDRPVSTDDWRRLPAEAAPILGAIASDPGEFPSRRANALGGLTARGSDSALHRRLAGDASVPFVVRHSALRGLGSLLPADQRRGALVPLLQRDPDRRIRATAAEVLATSAPGTGCAAVRAQLSREKTDDRPAFQRALAACGER
jgi:hypothetical protein